MIQYIMNTSLVSLPSIPAEVSTTNPYVRPPSVLTPVAPPRVNIPANNQLIPVSVPNPHHMRVPSYYLSGQQPAHQNQMCTGNPNTTVHWPNVSSNRIQLIPLVPNFLK